VVTNQGIDATQLNGMLQLYAKKSDTDSLLERLESLEKEHNSFQDKTVNRYKKWKPRWKEMKEAIKEL